MTRYSVVLCGLQPEASDDAAAWSPVAVALKLEPSDFARQVVAALPRIVRLNMDQALAERLVAHLDTMQISARALPDDDQLVYFLRDGSRRGPLPRQALDAFIRPGESYRLHGSQDWQTWGAVDLAMAESDAADDADRADPDFPQHEFDHDSDGSVSSPPPLPGATVAADAVASQPIDPAHDAMPPPPSAAERVDALAAATADPIEANPPSPTAERAGDDTTPPTVAAAAARPRGRYVGRSIAVLLVAALAFWAYVRWQQMNASEAPAPAPERAAEVVPNSASAPPPAAAAAVARADELATPATTAPAPATSVTMPAVATSAPAASAPAASSPAAAPAATTASPGVTKPHPTGDATTTTAPARPSFDCEEASSIAEVAICGDRVLSQLDREQAHLYQQALARATPEHARALAHARQQWRQALSPACGVDQRCIAHQLVVHSAAMQPALGAAASTRRTPP